MKIKKTKRDINLHNKNIKDMRDRCISVYIDKEVHPEKININ